MTLLIIYSLLSVFFGIAYTIHNFRIKNISGAIGTIILILSNWICRGYHNVFVVA